MDRQSDGMRFAIYSIVLTALAAGAGYALFVQNGIDPLAPEVRTIMLLSILAALYVGIRLTSVIRAFERRGEARAASGEAPKRSAFNRWGRSSSLDARMEARRERVRQAREAASKDD